MKKILKSVMLVLIFGLLTGIRGGFAQSAPTTWNDSLRVSIADSSVDASGYLHFKIVVERMNKAWNNNDTILGESDFYFWANLDAFVGAPELVSVHPHLWGGAALGTDSARLQVTTQVWAGRLQVALTDRGGTNNKHKYKVALGFHKPDTICEVKWKLTPVYAVNLGIFWDGGVDGSTGLQTLGGNPILESLEGSIPKIPEPLIDVDCGEGEYAVCEGSDIAIGLHALSSGDSLKFIWYDSIPAQALSKIDMLDSTRTIVGGNGNVTYKYRFNAKGDSLYLYNVPGGLDSLYFFCVIQDSTINYPAQYCSKQLLVRDSIWGFISPANDALTHDQVDTITACIGDDIAVRFNFYGLSLNEFADVDSVYFVYVLDSLNSGGYRVQDTAGFSVSQLTMSNVNYGAVGGQDVYWFPGTVSGYGKYYLSSIYTRYCSSAAPDVHYDTLFVEPGNTQTLPRLTALVGQSIIMDSVNSPIFSNGGVGQPTVLPTAMHSLQGLGTITTAALGKLPFTYTAGSVSGLDTVTYTLPGGDQCMIMREIEVQDLKYLALKVFLEGPYLAGSNTMRAFLTTTNLTNPIFNDTGLKNTVGSHYISPYEKDSVECNQFRTMLAANESQGKYFTDFIYIRLRDGATGSIVASKTALLRTDGIVCNLEGHEYLGFKNLPGSSYYVIVQHRNHLRIMSANSINLPVAVSSVAGLIGSGTDFSDKVNVMDASMGYSNESVKRMSNNKYVMYGGDVSQTNGSLNVISQGDINAVRSKVVAPYNTIKGYYKEDVTLDGYVVGADKNYTQNNRNCAQKFLP